MSGMLMRLAVGFPLATGHMPRLAVLLFVLAAVAGPASAQATPRRWFFNGSALPDFEVTRDTTIAHTGRVSLRVRAAADPSGFAGAMTTFPAAPYLGATSSSPRSCALHRSAERAPRSWPEQTLRARASPWSLR